MLASNVLEREVGTEKHCGPVYFQVVSELEIHPQNIFGDEISFWILLKPESSPGPCSSRPSVC